MANRDKNPNQFLTGAIIGGIVGICAASFYSASKRKEKESSSALNGIEEAVIHMGEALSAKNMAKVPMANKIGKQINDHEDVIANVVELISSGINLWEKFRKEV